jgi:hypothetical protein
VENFSNLLTEQQRFAEALQLVTQAANTDAARLGSMASCLLPKCKQQVMRWLTEFDEQCRCPARGGAEPVPRWPLTAYALRLAQLDQFKDAQEMVNFHRHFQPRDLALAKLSAGLQAILSTRGAHFVHPAAKRAADA